LRLSAPSHATRQAIVGRPAEISDGVSHNEAHCRRSNHLAGVPIIA